MIYMVDGQSIVGRPDMFGDWAHRSDIPPSDRVRLRAILRRPSGMIRWIDYLLFGRRIERCHG